MRGSSCATTPRYFSSSESEFDPERGNSPAPTVRGRIAPRKQDSGPEPEGWAKSLARHSVCLAMGPQYGPEGEKLTSRETLDAG